MPVTDDPELLRLKGAEGDALQRFERLRQGVRDSEILRHAKDIWLEAKVAASEYEK